MTKKIVISIIVILLLILAVGGFFYWWNHRQIRGSVDDFVIKETSEGKIIENKKAGLTIKAPEGWEVKKMNIGEGLVSLNSSDATIELKEEKVVLPIQLGCLIQTNVIYKKATLNEIRDEVLYNHYFLGAKIDNFVDINIKNLTAIKNNLETEKYGSQTGAYLPYGNKVYSFYLFWGPNDKENCDQVFNKFLESVSIR